MKCSSRFRTIIAIAVLVFAAWGTRAELMVGDKAPKLQTGKWLQGKPVRAFDRHHVYVVEFWATWCGPCVASIPHLNALWQKFKNKGVIVIGQDIWDSDDAVAPFVKKMGTNMTYRVALDDKTHDADGWMADHWWKRKINYHGIPNAFVINKDGIIAWIGHPMGLTEQTLNDIVSGQYDLAKAAEDYKKDWAADIKFQALQMKLFSAVDAKEWDEAESAFNEIMTSHPKLQNGLTGMRLQILLGQKKYDQAYDFANSFSNAHASDADWQNTVAWSIATSEGPDGRCLGLAEKIAERANEITHGTNAEFLDTAARVQFMLGKKDEAVATEEKAVNMESDPGEKGSFEKTLTSYKEGKLPKAEY